LLHQRATGRLRHRAWCSSRRQSSDQRGCDPPTRAPEFKLRLTPSPWAHFQRKNAG
jgi:hypothetical protein